MTCMRLFFAGQIKKTEVRQVGDKSVLSLSVCKKNYSKEGTEPTFTWIAVSIWSPLPDWLVNKCVKGAMIAGSGEFSLRSYTDKTGGKAVSAEVRCSSFDVEVGSEDGEAAAPSKPTDLSKLEIKKPQRPVPVAVDDDNAPPF